MNGSNKLALYKYIPKITIDWSSNNRLFDVALTLRHKQSIKHYLKSTSEMKRARNMHCDNVLFEI